jgi:hypothetical protein
LQNGIREEQSADSYQAAAISYQHSAISQHSGISQQLREPEAQSSTVSQEALADS